MSDRTGADLPCGRSWDDLLEQVSVGDGRPHDRHQQECAHCQAALAELGRLWGPVRALAAERVQAPARLTERVMRTVRETAQERWHSLQPGERGSTRVAARVIGTLARLAAGRVPGVAVALGRSTDPATAASRQHATDTHRWPGTAVGVAGGSAVVEIALAVEYGTDIAGAAEQVRQAVVRDIAALGGLDQVHVDITVDDVLPRSTA